VHTFKHIGSVDVPSLHFGSGPRRNVSGQLNTLATLLLEKEPYGIR
jgi:hypothetical protein